MTMANLPALVLLGTLVVAGGYALLGAGGWLYGRRRERPPFERLGRSLVLVSVATFGVYVSGVAVWVGLYDGSGSVGSVVGIVLVVTWPVMFVLPPTACAVLYVRDEVR